METKKNYKSLHIILSIMILVLAANLVGFFITSSQWYKNLSKPPIYNISETSKENLHDQLLKKLNLNTEEPSVLDILYGNNRFYVKTENGILETQDFIRYDEISLPFDSKQLHALLGSKFGLVSISTTGKPYVLNENGKWHQFDKKSPKYLKELAFGGESLCIIDATRQSIKTVRFKNAPDVIYIPQSIFRDIKSDGQILASTYTNVSKATENGLPLLLSATGESWAETTCFIPVSPDGKVGSFEIKSYKGQTYVRTRTNNNIPTLSFYKIIKSPSGFISEFLFDYEYASAVSLDNYSATIYNIFSNNSTKNTEPGIIIPSYADLKEFLLIRQITDLGLPIKYFGDKLFFTGKYGTILSSSDTLNWNWSGLYQRNSISRSKLLSLKTREQLGIKETDGYYWFNISGITDNESGLFLPRPFIYVTTDGRKWTAINFSESDIIDFNSNSIEAYVRGKEIYLINKISQKWWTVSVNKNGSTRSTIKASYYDIDNVYEEIGLNINRR